MFEHLLRTPKVHELVVKFLTDVNAGVYDLGRSLPPLRVVAKTYGVSVFTVHRAFEALKQAGIVRSEGGRAGYVDGDRLESFNAADSPDKPAAPAGRTVTLLVRRYSDLRKLGSSLLRERFHQHLKQVDPELSIREIQTDLSGGAYHAELFNRVLSSPHPSTGLLTQTCLDYYNGLKLLAPIRGDDLADCLARVRPPCKAVCSRDGEPLLVPSSITFSYLLYNKKAFAELGVVPADIDSWDAFHALLSRFRAEKDIQAPLALEWGMDTLFLLMHFVYQGGAAPQFGRVAPKIDWKGAQAEKGIKFFHKLVFADKLVAAAARVDVVPRLLSGELPLCLDCGQTAGAALRCGESGRLGIMPVPAGPNGAALSLANVSGYFINAKATAEERQAAGRYIAQGQAWREGGKGSRLMATYRKSRGLVSVRDDGVNPELPDDWSQALAALQDKAVFEPAGSDWEKTLSAEMFDSLSARKAAVSAEELTLYLNSCFNNLKFWEEPL